MLNHVAINLRHLVDHKIKLSRKDESYLLVSSQVCTPLESILALDPEEDWLLLLK